MCQNDRHSHRDSDSQSESESQTQQTSDLHWLQCSASPVAVHNYRIMFYNINCSFNPLNNVNNSKQVNRLETTYHTKEIVTIINR